jgi:cytochrome c oxidase assembly protein subunit 15
MNATTTAVLQVAVIGALLASLPLAWIWARHRGLGLNGRLRLLTLFTLFLTFDLVLFGAFTRLTDSGLGCPDWPGCYGHASPLGAAQDIAIEQARLPSGPVTHGKAWIEMVHRYFATGVGALITVLMVSSWWQARRRGPSRRAAGEAGEGDDQGDGAASPGWATLTFVWVCAQGAFGALTVTMKLYPAIVTLHLLGGIGLLALLAWQAERHRAQPIALPRRLRAAVAAVGALVVLQVALGGWVSTNYAVLACSDVPTCQGQWWPPMDFERGFTLQRELGHNADGSLLPFEALTAIHMAHRLAAVAVLAALLSLAVALRRCADAAARRRGTWLGGLAVLQLATGLSNVVLGWPIVAALLHTGGAALIVALLVALASAARVAARQAAPTPRTIHAAASGPASTRLAEHATHGARS